MAPPRAVLERVWPHQSGPRGMLLRELATLLLEDPDHRLRASHAAALLQVRLSLDAPSAAALESAIADAGAIISLQRVSGEDWRAGVVRLDMAALDAAVAKGGGAKAAARLQGNSSGSGDDEKLTAAITAAWPDAESDDADYLAAAIATALLTNKTETRGLPPRSLHLTDVGGALRAWAATDTRLAAIFPRNRDLAAVAVSGGGSPGDAGTAVAASGRRSSTGGGGGSANALARDHRGKPRLSEFVVHERCQRYFSMSESQVRKGEKVLTLLVNVLLENLAAPQPRAPLPAASPPPAAAAVAAAEDAAPLWAPLGLGGAASGVWAGGVAPGGLFGGPEDPEAHRRPGGLEPLTPAPFASPWAIPTAAATSAGGAPLPALQPLVGSFSMGTGLGLGTLLRGFGTDADGAGLGDVAASRGSFGSGGGRAGSGGLGGTPCSVAGGDGLFLPPGASPLASVGMPLGGSSPLDLVPRAIACVWGAPGRAPASAPQPEATTTAEAGPGSSGGGSGPAGSSAEDGKLDETSAIGGMSASSSGLLSLQGMRATGGFDSSMPDSEGSGSPLSGADSEGQPEATAAAIATACLDDGDETHHAAAPLLQSDVGPGGTAGSQGSAVDVDSSGDAAAAAASAAASLAADEGDDDITAADAGAATAPKKALTGWAMVAAKTPPKPQRVSVQQQAAAAPRSVPAAKETALAGALSASAAVARRTSDPARAPLARLHPSVREEVERLIVRLGGVVRHEDFDEGVVHQLNSKKTWEEAADAVRHLATYDLASIQHPAAYINHVIKHHGGPGSGGAGAIPGQIRVASVPISTKAMLHKCGVRVYRRVEEAIASSSHLQWHHFDAGVVKVLAELAKLSEDDVFEELDALKRSDLKTLQHVPAYLNKRLNNRRNALLRRKA